MRRRRSAAAALSMALLLLSLAYLADGAPDWQQVLVEPHGGHGTSPAVAIDDAVSEGSCGCPAGNVSDCCCSFADIESSNSRVVHSLLKRVVALPFFGHFRVNLCSTCGLWQDNPLCVLRDCSVCECEAPPAWTKQKSCTAEESESLVDQEVLSSTPVTPSAWSVVEEEQPAEPGDEEIVVNLHENPERYTGYSGESAERVWAEVHGRNCFGAAAGQARAAQQFEASDGVDTKSCELQTWQRVYDRLLSGLHSSISLHIAHGYCLERSTSRAGECDVWGPNASVARDRVLSHPDRVENLYATFAVLLRAVTKAGDLVTAAVPSHDEKFADSLREWKDDLLPELVRLGETCPKTFAEEELAVDGSTWEKLQDRLEHLAEIMKCVGCDRCKLWGTLQTQGVATALKVLFQPGGVRSLTRQESVALVHTLERLSSSIAYVREFRRAAPLMS